MKDLQEQGKVRFLGLSECSVSTLERALKVARIEAVQIEYSPWETNPERSGLLDLMRKEKISLVSARRNSIPQRWYPDKHSFRWLTLPLDEDS